VGFALYLQGTICPVAYAYSGMNSTWAGGRSWLHGALLTTQHCHFLGEMLMRLAQCFMKISFAAHRSPWQKEPWSISQRWF